MHATLQRTHGTHVCKVLLLLPPLPPTLPTVPPFRVVLNTLEDGFACDLSQHSEWLRDLLATAQVISDGPCWPACC